MRLDLDATVDAYTRTAQLVPVFRPASERWFNVAVIRDNAPSMAIWADDLSGFAQVLRRAGTFRTVRGFRLSLPEATGDIDSPPRLTSDAGRPWRPGRLLAPDGRRLIVLVTDGAAPGWRDREIWQVVRGWAASTPTVVISPLAVRLWRQTGLDLPTAHVAPAAPGSRNALLKFTLPLDLREPGQPAGDWLPVPAVTLNPHRLKSWARTLMRGDPAGCEALLIPPAGRVEGDREVAQLPVDRNGVNAFLRLSSAAAARLAVLCSPFKTVSLPLLRLIGQDLVPATTSEDVAEVLVSGLFLPPETGADGPQYPFHDTARTILREQLADADLWHVYDVLRSHVVGGALQAGTFTAGISDPEGDVAVPLEAGAALNNAALELLESLKVLPPGVPVIETKQLVDTSAGSPAADPPHLIPRPTSPAQTPIIGEPILHVASARLAVDVELTAEAATDTPIFFLSYAHPPKDDRGVQIPDPWIGQLYNDLCAHIRFMADLPHGARVGFMDQELRPGNEWPDRLSRALATCRVFVPLYSRRYFRSEHCGKEWFAFNRRRLNLRAQSGIPVETIVPAVWIPLPPEMLPEAATSVQYRGAHVRELYAEHGFYGLIKVSRWRDAYEEAVYLLAKEIVQAAKSAPAAESPPEPAEDAPYEMLPSAFGGEGKAGPGDKPIRLTVVAPSRDNLPAGRDSSYYGKDIRAWNPYGHASVRPLADHAAELARSLSYTPEVGDLFRHEAGLVGREPWSGPEVLLIDPWATLLPNFQDILRQIDSMDNPWVQVIVVWNHEDVQMRLEGERITAGLNAALPRKLREGRAISPLTVRGVPSLREFGMVFPPVIAEAGRHYLRRVAAYRPEQERD